MLTFYDFIQVYVFTTNHHLNDTLFCSRVVVNIHTWINRFIQLTDVACH